MSSELAARGWDLAWKQADGELPDGPAELWMAVFSTAGEFMGAAPARRTPAWRWRNGRLCLDYSPVRIVLRTGGWYETGVLCAVVPGARAYRPLVRLPLGKPAELRAGDVITVADGVIEIGEITPGSTEHFPG